ncbi:hypothetical protein NDA11_006383 [Ustilago hordei]|nr:hypothetical protein NDA11_006383 [Ustilago hordei]
MREGKDKGREWLSRHLASVKRLTADPEPEAALFDSATTVSTDRDPVYQISHAKNPRSMRVKLVQAPKECCPTDPSMDHCSFASFFSLQQQQQQPPTAASNPSRLLLKRDEQSNMFQSHCALGSSHRRDTFEPLRPLNAFQTDCYS